MTAFRTRETSTVAIDDRRMLAYLALTHADAGSVPWAPDAVAAAETITTRLGDGPIRLRIGVHTPRGCPSRFGDHDIAKHRFACDDVSVMKQASISSGGQVSIPAEIRRRWGTSRLSMEDRGDALVLRPIPADPVAAAIGSLAGPGISSDAARSRIREEERVSTERRSPQR